MKQCPDCDADIIQIERTPEGRRTCKNGHINRIINGEWANEDRTPK